MSNRTSLVPLVESLQGARVLCVGDVILDHFHSGVIERISPEAPVPVLTVEREDSMLGGAGNVIRNLAKLGAKVHFVTVVGKDEDGEYVSRLVAEEGVSDIPLVDDSGRRTSAKTRHLADGQQVLRTDRETVFDLNEDMANKVIDAATKALNHCNVMILSDYCKGVLTDDVIRALIEAAEKAGAAVIVDPKGDDYERYRNAGIVTPNRRELFEATGMPVDTEDEIILAAQSMIDDYDFGAVLATRSKDGMTLLASDHSLSHLKAEARDVYDVSGAGDTVVATLGAALSVGGDLEDSAELANIAAGIVVGKVGTAVASSEDLVSALHHQDLTSAEAKILNLDDARQTIETWRRNGQEIGFTNGCFDLLHPGHVSLLRQARAESGRLVVGLNSDTSVHGLKGEGRPVQTETARATVLASLATVDMVVIFSEETPLRLIETLRPDVLIKGADYTLKDVVGADIVQSYGGRVSLIDLEPGHSTTATIARLAGETC